MKYAFSSDFDEINKNIGVSDELSQLFYQKAKEVCIRAVMFDKSITDKSQAMEIYLNDVQPDNMIEAFWAGCIFNDIFNQTENIALKVAKSIQV